MSDFELQPCRHQDLDQVYKLEAECFPDDAYGLTVFLYFFAVERNGFLVAHKGDKVAGYVIATRQGGDGLIQSIAVLPEFRRMGLGEALMKAALDHLAKRFERVYLQVDAKHEGTLRFYRRLSFKETGKVHKGYYPNGDDGIEMVRPLTADDRMT